MFTKHRWSVLNIQWHPVDDHLAITHDHSAQLHHVVLKHRDPWIQGWTQARNQGRGIWGICPPEIFKTLHNNFDICKNFQIKSLNFAFLIIFLKKFYLKFSLSYWLIISLHDVS